jgi:hypothetical protein
LLALSALHTFGCAWCRKRSLRSGSRKSTSRATVTIQLTSGPFVHRLALVLLVVACSSRHHASGDDDASTGSDGSTTDDASSGTDGPSGDGSMIDATTDAMVDAFPGILDVHINCHNDCVLIADPPSITVTAGTEFKVNWINTGDTECDVAKIDQFNQVPIILGLEPGMSYFDSVHPWCGTLFTGKFDFRISICTIPSYIPVDCGGM